MRWRIVKFPASLAGVALITWITCSIVPVNATTVGFAYLLLVLFIATLWGFPEASVASIAATLTFNFYFLPPTGEFTIEDPQNWVALFSFVTTALVASRLSAEVKRRALDAMSRQRDLERLYTFSRAILLIDATDPFPAQLARKLSEIFELTAVVLYDRRAEEFYRAGPSDFHGLDDQLREAALQGTFFADDQRSRTISAVRLGAEPIAGLAMQGARMPDSVLQGVCNLVAIGLERARAQDLTAQVEAAKQTEKLRTTLLDAMAHEFKTPLTSVIAATSGLLDDPDQPLQSRLDLLETADEEARHLKELIDDAIEMARLDSADLRLQADPADVEEIVRDVVRSMRTDIEDRRVQVVCDKDLPVIMVDCRLVKLAIKQLLDNALKYSPPNSPVVLGVQARDAAVTVSVTDHGEGISSQEQSRIFERLYRSPRVQRRIPGSGLGLSIAQDIARAHQGDLSVTSRPGETVFCLTLPAVAEGASS